MYNESFELNSSENMHKEFNPHNYFALKYQEIKKNFKNLDFKLKRRNNRLGLGNIGAPDEGMTRDLNKKLGYQKQFLDQNGHMSVRNSLAQRKTQGSNMRRIMHRDQSDMPSRDFYKYTVSRSKKQGSFWNKAQKQNILPKVSVDKTSEDQKEPKEDFRNIKNTLDKHHRNYKGSNKASYLGRKFNNLEKRLGHLLTNPGLNSSFEPKDNKKKDKAKDDGIYSRNKAPIQRLNTLSNSKKGTSKMKRKVRFTKNENYKLLESDDFGKVSNQKISILKNTKSEVSTGNFFKPHESKASKTEQVCVP